MRPAVAPAILACLIALPGCGGEGGGRPDTLPAGEGGGPALPPGGDGGEAPPTAAANRAPVVEQMGDVDAPADQRLMLQLVATDPDGDALEYLAVTVPDRAAVDPRRGPLVWIPAATDAGVHAVEIRVRDDGSPRKGASIRGRISVPAQNRPPVVEPLDEVLGRVGEPLTVRVQAVDPDGDEVRFAASPLPEGARLGATSGALQWTPGVGDAGSHELLITVVDDGSPPASAVVPLRIVVVRENRPPTVHPAGDVVTWPGNEVRVSLGAEDPDGDSLTFAALELPAGATLDPVGGVFRWRPGDGDLGRHTARFEVRDDGLPPLSAEGALVITVDEPPIEPLRCDDPPGGGLSEDRDCPERDLNDNDCAAYCYGVEGCGLVAPGGFMGETCDECLGICAGLDEIDMLGLLACVRDLGNGCDPLTLNRCWVGDGGNGDDGGNGLADELLEDGFVLADYLSPPDTALGKHLDRALEGTEIVEGGAHAPTVELFPRAGQVGLPIGFRACVRDRDGLGNLDLAGVAFTVNGDRVEDHLVWFRGGEDVVCAELTRNCGYGNGRPGAWHRASLAIRDLDGRVGLAEATYRPTRLDPIRFTDATARAGLNGYRFHGNSHTGGVAWIDYDGDGWADLFVINGAGGQNRLFHNEGDGTFRTRPRAPRLASPRRPRPGCSSPMSTTTVTTTSTSMPTTPTST